MDCDLCDVCGELTVQNASDLYTAVFDISSLHWGVSIDKVGHFECLKQACGIPDGLRALPADLLVQCDSVQLGTGPLTAVSPTGRVVVGTGFRRLVWLRDGRIVEDFAVEDDESYSQDPEYLASQAQSLLLKFAGQRGSQQYHRAMGERYRFIAKSQ